MGVREPGLAGLALLLLTGLLLATPAIEGAGRGLGFGGNDLTLNSTALQLTGESFDSALNSSKALYALVEFYASWCPHCIHFKPEYNKVAALFNEATINGEPFVLVAGVDCAKEGKICSRFSIDRYPTMLWAQPQQYSGRGRTQGKDDVFQEVKASHQAEAVVEWVNKVTNQSFSLKEDAVESNKAAAVHAKAKAEVMQPKLVAKAADMWDIEEATALAFRYMLDGVTEANADEKRSKVVPFIGLLASHHPSARCRQGAAELSAALQDLWPLQLAMPEDAAGHSQADHRPPNLDALRKLKVCGGERPAGQWHMCAPSQAGSEGRGYSCGLWLLFHSLAARLGQAEGAMWLHAVRSFVDSSFVCDECRQHFLEMAQQPAALRVASRKDAVLWIWQAHNQVNKRLAAEETASGRGDLGYPKLQWPTPDQCPACQAPLPEQSSEPTWVEEEVYSFLLHYYGSPASGQEESGREGATALSEAAAEALLRDAKRQQRLDSTSVPVGAAAGLALASCSFAVMACLWRMQQKKRKRGWSRGGSLDWSPGLMPVKAKGERSFWHLWPNRQQEWKD